MMVKQRNKSIKIEDKVGGISAITKSIQTLIDPDLQEHFKYVLFNKHAFKRILEFHIKEIVFGVYLLAVKSGYLHEAVLLDSTFEVKDVLGNFYLIFRAKCSDLFKKFMVISSPFDMANSHFSSATVFSLIWLVFGFIFWLMYIYNNKQDLSLTWSLIPSFQNTMGILAKMLKVGETEDLNPLSATLSSYIAKIKQFDPKQLEILEPLFIALNQWYLNNLCNHTLIDSVVNTLKTETIDMEKLRQFLRPCISIWGIFTFGKSFSSELCAISDSNNNILNLCFYLDIARIIFKIFTLYGFIDRLKKHVHKIAELQLEKVTDDFLNTHGLQTQFLTDHKNLKTFSLSCTILSIPDFIVTIFCNLFIPSIFYSAFTKLMTGLGALMIFCLYILSTNIGFIEFFLPTNILQILRGLILSCYSLVFGNLFLDMPWNGTGLSSKLFALLFINTTFGVLLLSSTLSFYELIYSKLCDKLNSKTRFKGIYSSLKNSIFERQNYFTSNSHDEMPFRMSQYKLPSDSLTRFWANDVRQGSERIPYLNTHRLIYFSIMFIMTSIGILDYINSSGGNNYTGKQQSLLYAIVRLCKLLISNITNIWMATFSLNYTHFGLFLPLLEIKKPEKINELRQNMIREYFIKSDEPMEMFDSKQELSILKFLDNKIGSIPSFQDEKVDKTMVATTLKMVEFIDRETKQHREFVYTLPKIKISTLSDFNELNKFKLEERVESSVSNLADDVSSLSNSTVSKVVELPLISTYNFSTATLFNQKTGYTGFFFDKKTIPTTKITTSHISFEQAIKSFCEQYIAKEVITDTVDNRLISKFVELILNKLKNSRIFTFTNIFNLLPTFLCFYPFLFISKSNEPSIFNFEYLRNEYCKNAILNNSILLVKYLFSINTYKLLFLHTCNVALQTKKLFELFIKIYNLTRENIHQTFKTSMVRRVMLSTMLFITCATLIYGSLLALKVFIFQCVYEFIELIYKLVLTLSFNSYINDFLVCNMIMVASYNMHKIPSGLFSMFAALSFFFGTCICVTSIYRTFILFLRHELRIKTKEITESLKEFGVVN